MDLISWLRRHGGFIDARLQIDDGPLGRGLFAKAWGAGNEKSPQGVVQLETSRNVVFLFLFLGGKIGNITTHMMERPKRNVEKKKGLEKCVFFVELTGEVGV